MNRPLIGLLLFGFAIRLGWGLVQPAELDERLGDQLEYLQLGRNLLSAHELSLYDGRFGQAVYAYRTPGYPLFIAAFGANVRFVRMAQALLDTSTVLAVYLLARRFLANRGRLIAAGLVAANPFLIYFSALILSETLFTALLAWGMYGLVRQRQPRLSAAVGLLLLAFSVLVRPSAVGLVILLAAAGAAPRGWGAAVRQAGLAGVMILAVLFPWAYRNAHHPQVRAWVWTTTNVGITTYDGFHDRATGGSDQKGFIAELRNVLSRMDEVERDAFLSQQAHAWIREHPGRSAELMAIKIARTLSPVPLSSEYGGSKLYVLVGLLYGVPFGLLVLLGLWKGNLARTAKVFLLLPAIYFTALHAVSVGSLRYRIPAEAPMAVIAGSWASHALGSMYGPTRRKPG